MLAIRMQRLGRKGHPTYRMVVQDSRQTPTSGKVIAMLGSYDPHTKTNTLVKEKAEFYLKNGAQPSERVARLLKSEGVKLPDWVKISDSSVRTIKNPDKLRKNRPAEPVVAEEPVVEEVPVSEEVAVETPEAETTESPEVVTETSADEPLAETEEKA